MNPSGRRPRSGSPGSAVIQFGVSRRSESQRSRAPGVRHLAAFEHDVVDAGPGEVMAHGEPGGAGADDHDRRVARSSAPSVGRRTVRRA